MKKRIIFIFALCVLLTCSCTNQKNDENTEISSESVFSIQDSEKETENETKSEDINSGKNPVEDMPANIVWNDLGIQIRAGSYHEFNCNLNLFGNFDEDEKYRITKKVYVNQKEYTLYADFTVN